MNTFQAGLMCTLLLVGTIAGLFGCMSAVRCHRRLAFAICLAITLLDFVPLAVLLSRLPTDEKFSSILWTAALLLTALSLIASFTLWHKGRRQLSPISVKESCDHLPSALCFAWENGLPCLKNLKMDELSHQLTGEALLNADVFWKMVEPQPIVTLENGQTWSFERVRLGTSGKTVYQITGTNITKEAQLKQELEKDNLRNMGRTCRMRRGKRRSCAPRPAFTTRSATRFCRPGSFWLERREIRKASAPHGDRMSGCCWGSIRMNNALTRLNSSPALRTPSA